VVLCLALAGALAAPVSARPASDSLRADLDGAPIKLSDVGNWYCHDFDYPSIHCFSSPGSLETSIRAALATTAVDFVTVYEFTGFAGSYMYMSQDYSVLATIGWNDRISSLKGRNGELSHFYVDWFYTGASYSVCCDVQLTSLGSYDNTFSSVHRN
jgi:hypothetical protein